MVMLQWLFVLWLQEDLKIAKKLPAHWRQMLQVIYEEVGPNSAAFECGETEQTAEHIITGCPL